MTKDKLGMAVQSGISGVVSLKRENGGNVARYGLGMHYEIEKKNRGMLNVR